MIYIVLPIGLILLSGILCIGPLLNKGSGTVSSKRDEVEKKKIQMRVEQLGNKFTSSATNKAIYKVETVCAQAGLTVTYGTFKVVSIASALISPVLVLTILHNVPLAVASIIGGYMLPMQLIRLKRNKRLTKLNKQSGALLNIITERFKTTHDISSCITSAKKDFEGQEPIYTELIKAEGEMRKNVSAIEALTNLAVRINSQELKQFCEYYPNIILQIGINEMTLEIMSYPFKSYEKQREKKEALEKRIHSIVQDNMIMAYAVPVIAIYQAVTNDTYLPFMLGTTAGKVGTTIVCVILIICVWILVAKIGAPINEGDE